MLHYRESGRGPAVLLLHAFPLNSRMWEPQVTALAGKARFIAVDFPGFGLSPLLDDSPSLGDYADRVIEVLEHLKIDEPIVAGLSMGGYVAFRLVERIAPRLRGVLLADTRANADTDTAAQARHHLAAEIEARGVEVAASEFIPKVIGATTLHTQPSLVDRVHAIILENGTAGVAAALRALAGRPDSTHLLATLRCPTVCVVGDEDVITPPEVAHDMASKIPKARVVVVPQAGHLTNLEAPEVFNEALSGLIEQVG